MTLKGLNQNLYTEIYLNYLNQTEMKKKQNIIQLSTILVDPGVFLFKKNENDINRTLPNFNLEKKEEWF